ncbi:MAG: hypothetical protein HN816_10545, partial [Gammaproteobacteria bacterium]|nr:hypothetical protein [Gammaproteobacteria bacterium]
SRGTANQTDDIYSLGCLIYSVLTGRFWEPGMQAESPLPPVIEPLLNRMMSESPFDRNVSLTDIRSELASYFDDDDSHIATVDFTAPKSTSAEYSLQTPVTARQSRGVSPRLAAIGLAGLLVVAILTFFLLPESDRTTVPTKTHTTVQDHSQNQPAQSNTASTEPGVSPFAAARLEFMQQEGEKVAREILRLQLDLEDQGVLLWGNDDFTVITNRLDAAEELFRERQLEKSLETYNAVQASLKVLLARIPGELATQIERGDQALADADHRAALEAFTIATAIEPGNADLKKKLIRAENLDEVLRLVRRAEMLEQEASLDDALSTYEKAHDMDELWEPAANGIGRVRETIRHSQFQQAMSLAFQAISVKDYELARSHFTTAQKILPDSTEPADGLSQVTQAETSDAITDVRKKAEASMVDGAWREAISSYEAALTISDSLDFARAGLKQAKWRLGLDLGLDKYLSDPPLLQSDRELQSASALLRDAMRVEQPSDELKRRLDILARLISTARVEIPVTILSDGKTSVTVRKHAHLGTVENQVVYLIPGRYTITGERTGYRDVRENLTLIAGRPAPEITVTSRERIR